MKRACCMTFVDGAPMISPADCTMCCAPGVTEARYVHVKVTYSARVRCACSSRDEHVSLNSERSGRAHHSCGMGGSQEQPHCSRLSTAVP